MKNPNPTNEGDAGDWGSIPHWEDPLGKEIATHSSVLPWEIPWTEEPGRLEFIGSHRVGYDLGTKHKLAFENILKTSLGFHLGPLVN